MSKQYPILFSEGQIGNLKIKNRVVMPAMGMNQSDRGFVNDAVINHYERRAKGGVGLIIVEVTCVDTPLGRNTENMLVIDDDKYIEGMKKLVDAIHKHGAKCFLQISHTGRGARREYIKEQPVGPSEVAMTYSFMIGYGNEAPRSLTVEEIKTIEDKYAAAALRAKKAGFDGVEFHCTGYYLGQQFLSSTANIRTDEYGGSKEKRITFHMNVINKIKKLVGEDFPIAVKLTVWEMGKDGGITLAEGAYYVKRFEEAGVHAIEVMAGMWSDTPTLKDTPDSGSSKGQIFPVCMLLKLVYSLKFFKKLKLKLIGGGRAADADVAENALKKKTVDFVFMGKGLLAEPDWVNLVEQGKADLIRPCIGCQKCIDSQLQSKGRAICSGNAVIGRGDNIYEIPSADVKKKVVVVGAGPAGVEVARIASMRGHSVVIFEKSDKVGGQLYEAVVPKHKQNLKQLIPYLKRQLEYNKIEVKFNKEATVENVLAEKPDVVITATGVLPVIPKIPGIESSNVILVSDVLKGAQTGKNVVIIGGGIVGCETAEYLASDKKNVAIIEMLDEVASNMVNVSRTILLGHLKLQNVVIHTKSKCVGIYDTYILVEQSDKSQIKISCDTVVIAAGYKPNNMLYEQLKDKVETYNIGDSNNPDSVASAVYEGYYTALKI